MKTLIILIALLLSVNFSSHARHSYYPQEYQDKFAYSLLRNNDLKNAIRRIMTMAHQSQRSGPDTLVDQCRSDNSCYKNKALTYREARKYLFGELHLKENYNGYYIVDVYCQKTFTESDGVGPMQIPDDQLNCEHTWPQSMFNRRYPLNTQKTDLHNLFPADKMANSTRGNRRFGEVSGQPLPNNCQASHFGPATNDPRGTSYFQPPIDHRGNVARALFYFSVRYQLSISDMEENYLRKWHREDSVDSEERNRNNMIFRIQGNRNPFIDYPEMVQSIDDF